MDEAEMKELLEQKTENPRLQRIPLNLGNKFNLSKGDVELANPLTEYPALLLLFGADWCNITKPFLNNLKAHYEQINLQTKNIEVIYISFDKTKTEYQNMIKGYPWLSIAFDDPRIKDLKEFYNVRSIPSLVLVDNQGEIVSDSCRQDIYDLGEDQAFQKWQELKKSSSKMRMQE